MKKMLLLCLFCASPAFAQESIVAQAKADLAATGVRVENVACSDFEIAKVVAGRLASQGAGLLQKDCCGDELDPNRSHCAYNGAWYAHDIVAFPDGRIVDIAIDGGGRNGPSWGVDVDPSSLGRYRSAVSLGLTGMVGSPAPPPPPIIMPPPAPPVPTVDYSGVLQQILESQRLLLDTQHQLLSISTDTNTHVVSMDRTLTQTLGSLSKFLGKYVAPAIGGYFLAKQLQTPATVKP